MCFAAPVWDLWWLFRDFDTAAAFGFWGFVVGEMAACCSQARAVLAAETTSAVSTTRGSSSTRWSAKRAGGVQKMVAERKGHLGTRLVVVETGSVASKQRATGLVVEAAKRISTGRSYALSSTLKIEEGKEEEVTALCKSIVEWAQEKRVSLTGPF